MQAWQLSTLCFFAKLWLSACQNILGHPCCRAWLGKGLRLAHACSQVAGAPERPRNSPVPA